MALTTGTKLGPYEIVSPLGAGGMGEVYRSRDTRLDRDVAIKVLPQHLSANEEFRTRFEREAKAVAALSHPNVLAIYDVGHQDGVAYAVTELLEGETLRELLNRSTISRRKALEIAVAVADGIAATHARGIVHRDLKPENIFVTKDSVVKILDFGLARVEGPESPSHDPAHTPTVTISTTPGTIIGTINYMSPEQIRTARADARSDVFSFGCVLYEMLTGQKAFVGETSADTMTAILREPPRNIRTIRQDVGPELERVIDRCLEKNAESRFQSAQDLAFTLRSILADSSSTSPREVREPVRRTGVIVGFLGTAIVVASFFLFRLELGKDRYEKREIIDSIAVLPWENVSRDAEQEYFVDGMTEALISDLAKIGSLKVISRTSVMRYKGSSKSLPEIARDLNVDVVVEGSVLRVGERVRITAQLIRAATDEHLWSESYDRDLSDILRLQSEVARTIAQQIKVTLTPQEQARMVAAPAINPAAHEAYLKGRFNWNKRSPDGLKKAVEYFEQAVSLAPDWPLGYTGLADAYLLMPWYMPVRASEAIPKAKAAAAKAIELDESLGEAHATLGTIATDYDWDWSTAEKEHQRALALSPNYATAHHWYSLYLRYVGRYQDAIAEITKAQELDPLSLIIGLNVGQAYYHAEDYTRAESSYRKTLDLDSDFALARQNFANTLVMRGSLAEAITEARKALRLSNNAPMPAATLGYACAKAGQPEEARKILAEFAARATEEYVAPTHSALVFAGLDERDRMFESLERGYKERDVLLPITLIDPRLATMRGDPRFADLVRRVGLPPLAPAPSKGLAAKPPTEKIMLAVLPFANDSGDNELDYLSDGIAETLINGFSRLDGLSTVPRSTAFRHKKGDADSVQLGRQLSATAVLTGRVLKRGENLTIQAELVDVAEGRQLWGERYQRKLADLVEIERDIARDITDALRLKLTGEEKHSLSRGYSQNSEAYRLYLHGRHSWTKRSKEGLENALRLFNEAVAIDPNFALAYSGLSDTYSLLPLYGWLSPREAGKKARQTAEKALQLDDGLAEAHTSMGMVWFYIEWEFDKAEREFERAQQLNPRYATVQQWWGLCAGAHGRFAEAKAKLRRAIELDPLTPIFTHNFGWVSTWENDWPTAMTAAKSGLDFAPEFFLMHQLLGWAQMELGQQVEGVASLKKAMEISKSASFARAYYANALGRVGRVAESQAMIDDWIEQSNTQYAPPTDIAIMYLGLGKNEEALGWLEKAFEERDVWLSFLAVHRYWDPLRDDPRFVDLLRRIGLPNLRAGTAPKAPSNLDPAP